MYGTVTVMLITSVLLMTRVKLPSKIRAKEPANWHTVFDSSLSDNPNLIGASYGLHLWNEMLRRSPGFDKNGRFPPDSLFERLCARYLTSDN